MPCVSQRKKSQLVYAIPIAKIDLIERVLRDNIKECAIVLKEDLKSVDFPLKIV